MEQEYLEDQPVVESNGYGSGMVEGGEADNGSDLPRGADEGDDVLDETPELAPDVVEAIRQAATHADLDALWAAVPDEYDDTRMSLTEYATYRAFLRELEVVVAAAARRAVYAPSDREDLASDVMTAFHKAMRDHGKAYFQSVRGWVSGTVRHKLFNYLNGQTRRTRVGERVRATQEQHTSIEPALERIQIKPFLAEVASQRLHSRLVRDEFTCPFHVTRSGPVGCPTDSLRPDLPRAFRFVEAMLTVSDLDELGTRHARLRADYLAELKVKGTTQSLARRREIPCLDWWVHIALSEYHFPTSAVLRNPSPRPTSAGPRGPRRTPPRYPQLPAPMNENPQDYEADRSTTYLASLIGPFRWLVLSRIKFSNGRLDRSNGCPDSVAARLYEEDDLGLIMDRHMVAVVDYLRERKLA